MENLSSRLNEIDKKQVTPRQQQIREKIAQRKQEEMDGNQESRRLWFATTLIKNSRITRQELGQRIGMSPENLHYLLDIQDDCALTTLKSILEAIDIDCKVHFDIDPYKKSETVKEKPRYDFVGDVKIEVNNSVSNVIIDCPENANMRFLADLVMQMGLSARAIADMSGIPASTFMRFFQKDDIKISYLCRIAEATGRTITWELNKSKKA